MARSTYLALVLATMCLFGSTAYARSVQDRRLLQTSEADANGPAPICERSSVAHSILDACPASLFGGAEKCVRCMGTSGCCAATNKALYGHCGNNLKTTACPSGGPLACHGSSCPNGLTCDLFDKNCVPTVGDSCMGQTKCVDKNSCKANNLQYKEGWFCKVSNEGVHVCPECILGPNCWGDPHIRGFDGSHFMFKGWPEAVFNMFSHESYQINALLQNYMKIENTMKTWMEEIAVKIGSKDQIHVKALGHGKLAVEVNGKPIALNGEAQKINTPTGTVQYLLREDEGEKVVIETKDMTIIVSSTSFNLNLDIPFISTTLGDVHGILGQSYGRWVSKSNEPLATGVEGEDMDYFVDDGLFGDDFTFNLFTGAGAGVSSTEKVALEAASSFR